MSGFYERSSVPGRAERYVSARELDAHEQRGLRSLVGPRPVSADAQERLRESRRAIARIRVRTAMEQLVPQAERQPQLTSADVEELAREDEEGARDRALRSAEANYARSKRAELEARRE